MVGLVTRLFAPQFADRLGEPGVLGIKDKIRTAIARPPHEIRDHPDVGFVIRAK